MCLQKRAEELDKDWTDLQSTADIKDFKSICDNSDLTKITFQQKSVKHAISAGGRKAYSLGKSVKPLCNKMDQAVAFTLKFPTIVAAKVSDGLKDQGFRFHYCKQLPYHYHFIWPNMGPYQDLGCWILVH